MIPLLVALLALDMGGAARDLARNVAAAAAREPVSVTVQNQSTLGPGETAEIRRTIESELRSGSGAAEVRLTISENLTHYLLVAELRRGGGEREVFVESWPRAVSPQPGRQAQITLVKRPLWEQEEPILDAAEAGDSVLVLDAARILLVHGVEHQTAPIAVAHPWPRDMRGRLMITGAAFTAWLPGTVCRGTIEPRLSADCHESTEPWPLTPGATATFAPARNYFAGHVNIDPWGAREVPPFYSIAPAGGSWIFAGEDGRARIYTRVWEASGTIEQWGSDLAGVDTPCGPRILATRASAAAEADTIQPYELVDGSPLPAGAALEFGGPITALWTAGPSATAVSHDLSSGRYAAYSLAIACGN